MCIICTICTCTCIYVYKRNTACLLEQSHVICYTCSISKCEHFEISTGRIWSNAHKTFHITCVFLWNSFCPEPPNLLSTVDPGQRTQTEAKLKHIVHTDRSTGGMVL